MNDWSGSLKLRQSIFISICFLLGIPAILLGQIPGDIIEGGSFLPKPYPGAIGYSDPVPQAPYGYYDVFGQPRVLPFLSHLALDRGYELPLPLGVQFVYTNMKTEMEITSVEVGFSGNPPSQTVPIGSENLSNDTQNLITRFDAWVLPFMNVYGLVGQTWIDSSLDLTVNGPGNGNVTLPIRVTTDGLTYGYGTTLAAGYKSWFFSVDANKTYVDLDELDSKIKKRTVGIRTGFQGSLHKLKGAVWLGAMHIERETTLDGSFNLENSLLDPVRFRVRTEMDEPWNFLMGFNWEPAPSMNLMLEGGFGSRSQITTAFAFRF